MATSEIPAVRRRDGVAVIDLVGDVNRGAEEALEAAWVQATERARRRRDPQLRERRLHQLHRHRA